MENASDQRPRRRGLRSEKSETIEKNDNEHREVVWPEFIEHSATDYPTTQHMFAAIRKEILHAISPAEITYSSIPRDWGALIADFIDNNRETEVSRSQISYNSLLKTLVIRTMPVLVHECHTSWVIRVQRRWEPLNLVTSDHLDNIDVYTNNLQERFAGQYLHSRKIPDLCIKSDDEYHPSFVIEVGWSESHKRLLEDMRLWLEGGAPHVKTVMVIKFTLKKKTNIVRGTAELWSRNPAGRPVRTQKVDIFPATTSGASLHVSAGDLFGAALPQGLPANTALPFDIDLLRVQARKQLLHMSMVEAT
ncbi:hypothetical protein CNMCM5793_009582 [Aspergillus hiratsukae]|uniref:Uncharacterized protein n=1 Tax=Aspergillus hiratsukae TaxID=1194566 RepID=A0A8H6PYG3_9EURO|nr:hypothetical protein CNMCM5793_009582 [Aspergillus hiratsukae]KAF7162519.1 hypothetical protein CNMCM6106_009438 [Aspergillus hiratsukae]